MRQIKYPNCIEKCVKQWIKPLYGLMNFQRGE